MPIRQDLISSVGADELAKVKPAVEVCGQGETIIRLRSCNSGGQVNATVNYPRFP